MRTQFVPFPLKYPFTPSSCHIFLSPCSTDVYFGGVPCVYRCANLSDGKVSERLVVRNSTNLENDFKSLKRSYYCSRYSTSDSSSEKGLHSGFGCCTEEFRVYPAHARKECEIM
jgi:hypothetical protein